MDKNGNINQQQAVSLLALFLGKLKKKKNPSRWHIQDSSSSFFNLKFVKLQSFFHYFSSENRFSMFKDNQDLASSNLMQKINHIPCSEKEPISICDDEAKTNK